MDKLQSIRKPMFQHFQLILHYTVGKRTIILQGYTINSTTRQSNI